MDRSSGKRSAGRLVPRTKACISGLKDATSEGDENAQFCNRIGCKGRIKYNRNTKTGIADKAQCSSPSSCSSNKNKLTGISSMCSSMVTRARKSYLDSKRKLSSKLNVDPSESSLSSESEAPELMSSPSGYQSESMKKLGEVTVRETRKLRMSTNALMPSPSSRTRDQSQPALMSSPSSRTGDQSESMKKSGEVTVREMRRPRISYDVLMSSPISRTRDQSQPALMSSPSSRTGDQSESMKKSGEVTVRETRRPRISYDVLMSSPISRTRVQSQPALMSSPSSRTGDQSESMKKSGEVTVRETRRPMISYDVLMSSPINRTRDQSESTKKSGEITLRTTGRPCISLNALMSSPSSRTRDKSESTKKSGDVTVTGAGRPRVSSSARMSPPSSQPGDRPESKKKSRDVTATETVRPRVSSNVRPIIFHDKSRLHHQKNPTSSSVPLASKSSTSAGASDVVPRSSSLELESAGKKRSSGGENSPSHRAIKVTTASTVDRQKSPSTRGISISDSRRSSGAASVSNRGPKNLNVRVRVSSQQNGISSSSIGRPGVRILQSPDNVGNQSSMRHLSKRVSSSGSRLSSPSNSIGNSENGFTRLTNHEMFPRHNMDRIAEELLAFGILERDEEWTHEEALELYLSNLDQHREMRLDIDNMSYEELLALEERMGTVSTALSEEALSKCLRRSIHQLNPSEVQTTGTGDDGEDIKCSICQEEYVVGDQIGKLVDCQHGYHVTCINEWLQLKNWCPICKASAGPSQSSLS